MFDLEFTAWPGSNARNWSDHGEYREIVQIGAIRADRGDGYRELDGIELLVRPRLNPVLSDYFVALTGITQERVEALGRSFADALAAFTAFVGPAVPIVSNGYDLSVLIENCGFNDLPFPLARGRFFDVGPFLAACIGNGVHVSSGDLPKRLAGVPDLPAHDALSDARMVAAALGLLAARGRAVALARSGIPAG